MTCNLTDLVCVRYIVFVANCFLWFYRVVILPFLPCQLLRGVWSIISYAASCCFTALKSVANHICSFLFCIWVRYIAGPTIEAIRCVITGFLYWGYHAVKDCVVYLVTLIFSDLYKLALILLEKDKEMGVSKKLYEYMVGIVISIIKKIFQYLSGNRGAKKFVSEIICGSLTDAKGLVSQSVAESVKNNATGHVSDTISSIKNHIPFLKSKGGAAKKSRDEDNDDKEVVEHVAEVSADRKLLNALPDSIQKSIQKCKSTIKEAFEEPDSVQAKFKSSLKQKLSRNTPAKKTL